MIRLDRLRHHYRPNPLPALDGVSFDIGAGGVFGLLGPNCAGKTTLLSLLAGRLALQSGEIFIDNTPLGIWRKQHPNGIAMAPRDYAFYPMLTLEANLEFFAEMKGLSRRARERSCLDALDFARLETAVGCLAGELPQSLQRRLNLVIALLGEPRIVLLDEPALGCDEESRDFLIDAAREYAEKGNTVIYASHQVEEIEMLASELAILDRGKVRTIGTLETVTQGGWSLEEVLLQMTHLDAIGS